MIGAVFLRAAAAPMNCHMRFVIARDKRSQANETNLEKYALHAGGFVVVDLAIRAAFQVGFRRFQRCQYRWNLHRRTVDDGDRDSAYLGRMDEGHLGGLVAGFPVVAGFQSSNRGGGQYHDRGTGGCGAVPVVAGAAEYAAADSCID